MHVCLCPDHGAGPGVTALPVQTMGEKVKLWRGGSARAWVAAARVVFAWGTKSERESGGCVSDASASLAVFSNYSTSPFYVA